jgi:pectate lyase
MAAFAVGICLLYGWSATAQNQLPTPLISLGFNENSGSSVANAGSVSATFSKTTPPSWSTNVPVRGGVSSVDFGTTTGNYYVESSAVISQLAGMTNFTVTGWVNNRNSSIGSGGNRIVSWIYNGGNGVDIVYASGGTLKVGINQWPDSTTAFSSAGMIPTDAAASASNWRFFAVAYNAATSTIQFYFGDNSTLASLDKSLTYSQGAVGASIGKLAIGHFNAESSRTGRTDRMFRGLIDQVQIFGSLLSLSEIQTAQNGGGVAAPVFTSATLAGSELVLQGTNGPANGAYAMLRSANVSEPGGNWQGVGIRSFDVNGNFSFTNPISSDLDAFYRLFVVSSVPVFPPVITGQPQNLARAVGQTANFSVAASGTAPLTYRWYFNTNTLLTSGSSSTLSLTNVQVSDSGKISVTVSNLLGPDQSTFATLTVTNSTEPPGIAGQPGNQNVTIGQTVNFSVTATGALPLSYQWYYNTNTPLAGQTNSTLTLLNVNTNQAGKYSVMITNLYGATNSAFATLNVIQELLAFPEAEGYGKYATGGRGGAVYEVTNLNPTGTGSFGAAITATGVRTVVFRVAGTITGNFNINRDNITIAGQTAPGDGICIKGSLSVSANNVIIRYIRVRLNTATSPESDTVGARGYQNIILDHVSASWSGDEVMSFYQNRNVTLQWCMITEACAKFIGGTNTGHQFGGIWGNNYGTYHHNLIAHNVSRNPRWASGCKYNDYRNNVIYNWVYESCYGGEAVQVGSEATWNFTTINMVANYYKYGPATDSGVRSRIANPSARSVDDKGSWYIADNYVNGHPTVTANNWLGVAGNNYIQLHEPWPAIPINQQTPADAYAAVLAHVGCSKPNRDSVDTRIINEVATGTAPHGDNGIINTPSEVGGWAALASGTPPVDTDHDGMPDRWESSHGLNPAFASDRNGHDLNPVYTSLEVYLNELGAF